MLSSSVSIKLDPDDIVNAMMKTIAKNVKKRLTLINNKVGSIFVSYIKGTEEWISLNSKRSDSLMGQLGIDENNKELIFSNILDTWKSSFTTKIEIAPDYIKVQVNGIREDYSDVLNLDVSRFVSKNGFVVPWLKWLLFEADNISLVSQIYRYKKTNKYNSRSGLGIMIKSQNGKPWIEPWKMPVQFAKPEQQNFVNRVANNRGFIESISEGILNELLQ